MKTRTMDRFRLPDGTFPPLAGGDPALADAVRSDSAKVAEAKAKANELWAEFDRLRTAAIESGNHLDPESAESKATQAANDAYAAAAADVTKLEAGREQALGWLTADAPSANGPQDGQAQHGDALSAGSAGALVAKISAGDIALKSEGYNELKARGAFTVHGRKSIDALLVARKEGGQRAMADALRNGTPAASLVTGTDPSSAGALVVPDRQPGIIGIPPREVRLVDLITIGSTDSDTVEYVLQKGGTNNAAETAEASAVAGTSGTKPLSSMELEKQDTTVKTVAHAIAATKRSLADAGQMRTLIEQFLTQGLDDRLDDQIAGGDGQGENIRGITNTPGIAQVVWRQAETGNTLTPELKLATVYRAIVEVRKTRQRPTAIGMTIEDWAEFVLMHSYVQPVDNQVGTAGSYGQGPFFLGGPIDIANQRLWGLPVVISEAFETGAPVVGDYRKAALWIREATQLLASDSHEDFFLRNMVAILAEFRAAFGVLVPSAFCLADISGS